MSREELDNWNERIELVSEIARVAAKAKALGNPVEDAYLEAAMRDMERCMEAAGRPLTNEERSAAGRLAQ